MNKNVNVNPPNEITQVEEVTNNNGIGHNKSKEQEKLKRHWSNDKSSPNFTKEPRNAKLVDPPSSETNSNNNNENINQLLKNLKNINTTPNPSGLQNVEQPNEITPVVEVTKNNRIEGENQDGDGDSKKPINTNQLMRNLRKGKEEIEKATNQVKQVGQEEPTAEELDEEEQEVTNSPLFPPTQGEPFKPCIKFEGNKLKYDAIAAGISTPIILLQLAKSAQNAFSDSIDFGLNNDSKPPAGSEAAITFNFCKSLITLLADSYDKHKLHDYLEEEIISDYKRILKEDIQIDNSESLKEIISQDPVHQ